MGKNSQHNQNGISIPNNGPGCMWGVFNILKYHHWRYIKKRLPHVKVGGGGGKRAMGTGDGNSENDKNASRTPNHGDVGSDIFTVHNGMISSSPVTKGSVTSRLKALIPDELYKKKGKHCRSTTYPTRSHLTRTDSIHHLEPIEEDIFADAELHNGSPRIPQDQDSSTPGSLIPLILQPFQDPNCEDYNTMLPDNLFNDTQLDKTDTQLTESSLGSQENSEYRKQNLIHAEEFNADASVHQSKEFMDAIDMINMNKEFFVGIFQSPGSPLAHHFHSQQALSSNMRYSKNVSFPLPGSSCRGGSKSGKSEHIKEGIEFRNEEEKLQQAGSEKQKSMEPKTQEYICSQSTPLIAAEYRADGIKLNQAMSEIADNLYSKPPHHLKKHGPNQVVMKRFKDLKHKLKHAIKESKNEKHRITMDAILHKIPHRHGFSKDLKKEIVDQAMNRSLDGKESPPRFSYESDRSLPSAFKGELRCFSRTSSFSESLDRYCQLYEFSFGREGKNHYPDTPNLRSEHPVATRMRATKSMRRILSLPNMKYHDESPDAFPSSQGRTFENDTGHGHPITSEQLLNDAKHDLSYDLDSEIYSNIRDAAETPHDLIVEGFVSADLGDPMIRDMESQDKHDIWPASTSVIELEEPSTVSMPGSEVPEATTSLERYYTAEEEDLYTYVSEFHPSTLDDQLAESGMDTQRQTGGRVERIETPSKNLNDGFLHCQVDVKDKAEFYYVRDILKLSGFSKNELLGTWHSNDQPVDPSVYEEVEGCMLLDPKCSGNEEGGNCYHLLLFDVINEVLMEIYAKSYAYYPAPLSTLSHIRPLPVGYHVLEEVWAEIRWYLSSCADADESLDYIVSRDLAKSDGWMNLQYEAECVGLEVEDFILDDLIQELICS